MNAKLKSLVSIIILIIFIFTSCTPEKKKIRVGYLPITLSLPFFVAFENGYFEEEGLEIEAEKYTTADQLTNALAANNIDVSANTSFSTYLKVNDNIPDFAKIYLVSIHTPENYLDALLAGNNSNIDSIPQLVGKNIGMFPGSTNIIYLSIALSNYFDPEEVNMIQLPPQTHIQALATGQVDALYTLEPLVTLCLSKGLGKELIKGSNSTYIVNPFPGGVYLVSNKYLTENKKTFSHFVSAINKALDFIKTYPAIARSYYSKYTPIDSVLSQKIHTGDWWNLDQIDKTKIDTLINVLIQNGYIEKYPQNEIYLKD